MAPIGTAVSDCQPGARLKKEAERFSPRRLGASGDCAAVCRFLFAASCLSMRRKPLRLTLGGSTDRGSVRGAVSRSMSSELAISSAVSARISDRSCLRVRFASVCVVEWDRLRDEDVSAAVPCA